MGELERLGVYVGNRTGNFRTLCPQCSHTRKNKRDRCLSVSVQPDGAKLFNCWHCGWSGAEAERDSYRVVQRQPKNQRGDFGASRRRERNHILSG